MEAPVIAAVITATTNILNTLITIFVKKNLDNKPLVSVPQRRRESVKGDWIGTVTPDPSLNQSPFDISIEFNTVSIQLEGKISYVSTTDHRVNLQFKGSFYDRDYLRLEYKNADQAAIQFGVLILKLSADATQIHGNYVGYGVEKQDIVLGQVVLHR
jgi:hypothetical protein